MIYYVLSVYKCFHGFAKVILIVIKTNSFYYYFITIHVM